MIGYALGASDVKEGYSDPFVPHVLRKLTDDITGKTL